MLSSLSNLFTTFERSFFVAFAIVLAIASEPRDPCSRSSRIPAILLSTRLNNSSCSCWVSFPRHNLKQRAVIFFSVKSHTAPILSIYFSCWKYIPCWVPSSKVMNCQIKLFQGFWVHCPTALYLYIQLLIVSSPIQLYQSLSSLRFFAKITSSIYLLSFWSVYPLTPLTLLYHISSFIAKKIRVIITLYFFQCMHSDTTTKNHRL